MSDLQAGYAAAARLIDQADALVIAAGAGIGVDSGLPDFRGAEGFWRAYPALGRAGLRFEEIASPAAFPRRSGTGLGFLRPPPEPLPRHPPARGFRTIARACRQHAARRLRIHQQCRRPVPARRLCRRAHRRMPRLAIHWLQCLAPCGDALWPADDFRPEIDADACRILAPMPRCPQCGGLARPAILMFGDRDWIDARTREQERRLTAWLRSVERPVVVEVGAGSTVATVRAFVHSLDAPLVRINPRESQVPRRRDVGLAVGAREGIAGIVRALEEGGGGSGV
jgi:NAD-dependent SIR2 family protein deacetylase